MLSQNKIVIDKSIQEPAIEPKFQINPKAAEEI
jgi:hypothetical protein